MGQPTAAPVPEYSRVSYLQPHWGRRKEILAEHPEVSQLQKIDPLSVFVVIGLIVGQLSVAYTVEYLKFNWVLTFVAAYVIGAFFCHALWVMVHELTHDLVLANSTANTFLLLASNVLHIFPSGITFCYYHRIHHSHLNETYGDPDVPLPIEDTVFGHTIIGKATWVCFFALFQSLRVIAAPAPIEWAVILNWAFNGMFVYYALAFMGTKAFMYLFLSSLFSIGFLLHPLGARWIAEHWAIYPLQETYSYYGPINRFSFNIGYHNEHHDFPKVPWSKLPTIRKSAPEFYDKLFCHNSYVSLMIKFITDRQFTLKSRVVRWPKNSKEQ